ncbi:MAG TPA: hypothetical protein VL172_12070 [Kofleriaceae bacterium]|nr:hypothetical protein [Kofleriaceae bacterium]
MSRGAIALLVLLVPATAAAQPAAPGAAEARKLYEAGRQAYDGGRYTLAISLFDEAYRIVPRSSVAFALGQALRRQYLADGDVAKLDRAVDSYRRYLAAEPQGKLREEATRHIGELELIRPRDATAGAPAPPVPPPPERTQLVIFSSPPQAQASIDGGPPQRLPAAVDVTPGGHRVRIVAAGYLPHEAPADAAPGRLTPIEVTLDELPAALRLDAGAGVDVEIDGQRVSAAQLAAPLRLRAGRYFVAMHRRGHHPYTQVVALARGQEQTVTPAWHRTRQRTASYWVLAGAGATLLAGLICSAVALDARSGANGYADRIAAGQVLLPPDLDRNNALVDRYHRFTGASYLLYAGAAALGATGLGLYLFDHPHAEPPLGGLGIRWSTRF